MILETEGGTETQDGNVGEGLEQVGGQRALEGRARKAKPLNQLLAHLSVSSSPTRVIKVVSGFTRP